MIFVGINPMQRLILSCRMFTASHETLLWVRKDKKAKHFFNYDLVKTHNWEGDFIKSQTNKCEVFGLLQLLRIKKKNMVNILLKNRSFVGTNYFSM